MSDLFNKSDVKLTWLGVDYSKMKLIKTKKMGRKYGDQSSTLALLLQTLEAEFMLDR